MYYQQQQPNYGQTYVNYLNAPPQQPLSYGYGVSCYPQIMNSCAGRLPQRQKCGLNKNYLRSILSWLRLLLIVSVLFSFFFL